ncbi:hypothetical protein L210DRAFT_3138585 [Boletus edulis BED1]|uniref:Uncharacterized protein n=1 Tax=Boletus edulis BED1 TaxID=1328754 RepID=A0AAD4BGN4_BOLED|nr:hypothetical protein L210DRAFT_3138585 [Boletus edulis BED1]
MLATINPGHARKREVNDGLSFCNLLKDDQPSANATSIPAHRLSSSMQTVISKIFKTVTQHVLGLTLYHMMQSSQDFEDVRVVLHDRVEWSIELFRSCFTIHLSSGGYSFMLCSLFFLVIAENIHIHYGRLSPAELKVVSILSDITSESDATITSVQERAEQIGYGTFAILFAILFAVLDIGFVIVRVAGLAALSGSPGLAVGLALISMSPSAILPLLTYPARLVRRRERAPTGDAEMNSETVVDGSGN